MMKLKGLDSLITSKTRIKLLLKFFSNKKNTAYLRSLAEEFGESSNSVRIELNRFADAGLLNAESSGNTKVYKANERHPLFKELNKLVIKYMGLTDIVDSIVYNLGDIHLAFVTDDYAHGIDSGIVDLVLVGKDIDQEYLGRLISKTENITNRKIRYLVLTPVEFKKLKSTLDEKGALILWSAAEDKRTAATPTDANEVNITK